MSYFSLELRRTWEFTIGSALHQSLACFGGRGEPAPLGPRRVSQGRLLVPQGGDEESPLDDPVEHGWRVNWGILETKDCDSPLE